MTAHVDAPQSFQLAVVAGDRLGEGAVDIQSDDPHACFSVVLRSNRELAGDTTSTDPRSRRIQESRKGRPCNELGLSAHCPLAACRQEGRIFHDQAMTLRRDECRELPQKAGWDASLVYDRLQFLRMHSPFSDMVCNAHEAIFRPLPEWRVRRRPARKRPETPPSPLCNSCPPPAQMRQLSWSCRVISEISNCRCRAKGV